MPAELEVDAQRKQRLGARRLGLELRQRDPRTAAREQIRRGNPASRRSGDRHALVPDIKSQIPIPYSLFPSPLIL